MSDAADLLDSLLPAWTAREPAPPSRVGQVSMAQAYETQVELLRRRVAEGAQHSGWKVGQTSAAMRAERGATEPAPGFMLQGNALESGANLPVHAGEVCFLEPELAIVMGSDLGGAEVTVDDVRNAAAGVASAFEIVRRFEGWSDLALQRSVNGSTAGYVLGPLQAECPEATVLDDWQVRCTAGGDVLADVRGADANDNPLETTAWLVRFLARHQLALKAGQVVLTGTYAGLLPVTPGQAWRATVGPLAPVALQT